MEIKSGSKQDQTYLERTEGSVAPGPSTPGAAPGQGLPDALRQQPALLERDWLPEGIWPELDELRNEHHGHLDACGAAGTALSDLRDSFDAEDRARYAMLKAGETAPSVTPTAERSDQLLEAEAKHDATLERFADFIGVAASIIKAKGRRLELEEAGHVPETEWRAGLTLQHNAAQDEREAARQALAAADRKVAELKGLERWLDCTVKPRGGRYLSHGIVTIPEPRPEPDLAAMAGTGMGGGGVSA